MLAVADWRGGARRLRRVISRNSCAFPPPGMRGSLGVARREGVLEFGADPVFRHAGSWITPPMNRSADFQIGANPWLQLADLEIGARRVVQGFNERIFVRGILFLWLNSRCSVVENPPLSGGFSTTFELNPNLEPNSKNREAPLFYRPTTRVSPLSSGRARACRWPDSRARADGLPEKSIWRRRHRPR